MLGEAGTSIAFFTAGFGRLLIMIKGQRSNCACNLKGYLVKCVTEIAHVYWFSIQTARNTHMKLSTLDH